MLRNAIVVTRLSLKENHEGLVAGPAMRKKTSEPHIVEPYVNVLHDVIIAPKKRLTRSDGIDIMETTTQEGHIFTPETKDPLCSRKISHIVNKPTRKRRKKGCSGIITKDWGNGQRPIEGIVESESIAGVTNGTDVNDYSTCNEGLLQKKNELSVDADTLCTNESPGAPNIDKSGQVGSVSTDGINDANFVKKSKTKVKLRTAVML